MKENGFGSIQVILVLFLLSLLVLGIGTGISLTGVFYKKREDVWQNTKFLQNEVKTVLMHLQNDPTPETDSHFDPVWTFIRSRSNNHFSLRITDISSRINPNWVRPGFLEKTDLRNFFLPGVTAETFKDVRNQHGFSLDITLEYSSLIKPSALEKYFTPFSYANINTSYEFVLQDLYSKLAEDPAGAEVFHTFIARNLSRKHLVSADEFYAAAGDAFDSLYPVINTFPAMNINFVPEFLLRQILSYPYGGNVITNSSSLTDQFIAIRQEGEIDQKELHDLIPIKYKTQERVFQYLGTKTWFWKVEIKAEKTAAEAIIICYPKYNKHLSSDTKGTVYVYRLYSFKLS